METCAQTSITIECDGNECAEKVFTAIGQLEETNLHDSNFEVDSLAFAGKNVYLFKSSGRVQNLECQCQTLWEHIKNIKGVIEMSCPFLEESDGVAFYNEQTTNQKKDIKKIKEIEIWYGV